MENENKKLEMNEIEKVGGGYATLGEPCEKGLTCPSMSVCPNKGCSYYCANYPLLPNYTIHFCGYFCVKVMNE